MPELEPVGESADSSTNGNLPAESAAKPSTKRWTPERREAQRQWAKQAAAEGRFGGDQRTRAKQEERAKTAADLIAEKASEYRALINKRLRSMLDDKSKATQMKAIDIYLKAESQREQRIHEEEIQRRTLSRMPSDELRAQLLHEMKDFLNGEEIIDAEAVEIITEHIGNGKRTAD